MKKEFVLGFEEIDKRMSGRVGGKGANLGELSRIAGIHVPEGFCVTTEAYREITADNEVLNTLLDQLSVLKADNRKAISEISAKVRKRIEETLIPEHMAREIGSCLDRMGAGHAYAVRSSATAEDLPSASFAGQQDTYLNVTGKAAILQHIRKCWASLFTDRAVTYRLQQAFDHRKVALSVIIQRMIFPEVAGVMFTADPVSSNRKVLAVDASFGLGEALVSGLVNADHYKVREGILLDKMISAKKLAMYASKEGGTRPQEVEPERQSTQALSDEQILQLARIGRAVEAHFGSPQDMEWCLAGDVFYMVQSRPITTLYPIPVRPDYAGGPGTADTGNHVYLSVGHNQMMTDAMKPLGLSFWLLTTPASMRVAGGRLFVDVTQQLASPDGRKRLIEGFGKTDHLIQDALRTVAAREDVVNPRQDEEKGQGQ